MDVTAIRHFYADRACVLNKKYQTIVEVGIISALSKSIDVFDNNTFEKAKPIVRWGRKATGLP